jgi:hypothetical protein
MNPEELLAAIKALGDQLKSDISAQIAEMDTKVNALADSVKKAKADAAGAGGNRHNGGRMDDDDEGNNPEAARRTAADSVHRSEFAALASDVRDMRKKQARPMADLNAFADVQAKSDAVMRALGERAEPPMAGEELIPYKIRMTRPMQRHSPKWKGVELQLIAADQAALEQVITDIRSDAMAAAMGPGDAPEFLPGGHLVREFRGNGTIFKQMSRPVRHVAYIGTRKN